MATADTERFPGTARSPRPSRPGTGRAWRSVVLVALALLLASAEIGAVAGRPVTQPPPMDECVPANMGAGLSFQQAFENCFAKPNSYNPIYQACVRARAPQDVAAVRAAVAACLAAPLPTTTPGPTPTFIPTATPGPTATPQATAAPPMLPSPQRFSGRFSILRSLTPEERASCVYLAAPFVSGTIKFEVRWGRTPEGSPTPDEITGSFEGAHEGTHTEYCGPQNGQFLGIPFTGYMIKRSWRYNASMQASFQGRANPTSDEFTLEGSFDGTVSWEYTENVAAKQVRPGLPPPGQTSGNGPIVVKGRYGYGYQFDRNTITLTSGWLVPAYPSGIELPGQTGKAFGHWDVGLGQ